MGTRRDGKPPGSGTAPADPGLAGRLPQRAVQDPQPVVGDPPGVTGDPQAGESQNGGPRVEAAGEAREPETAPGPAGRPEKAGRPDRVPWLIALAVFAVYLPISVFRYLRFDPTSWDLGIFTEYVKQYADLHAPIVDIRGAG